MECFETASQTASMQQYSWVETGDFDGMGGYYHGGNSGAN